MAKKGNYAPQTKTILGWERKQAWKNIKKGIPLGIVIGAVAVLFGFFIGKFF
jgi:hypothetical protein